MRHRLTFLVITVVFTLALTTNAHAQISSGDILVNMFGGDSHIERFHPDGTHVWSSSGGVGTIWSGCAITPSGHVVTAYRPLQPGLTQSGVNVFDSDGVLLHSFPVPQIVFTPGDIGVFSDGTLAIVDTDGAVDYYTETGTFVLEKVFSAPGSWPAGCFVDANDRLFVCDRTSPAGLFHGQVYVLNRAGQLLATIPLPFWAYDVVVASDDTLWLIEYWPGHQVDHVDMAGTILGRFPVGFSLHGYGIARDGQGAFWTSGGDTTEIKRYTDGGHLLATIDVPSKVPAITLFLTIAGCGPDPTTYCAAKVNSLGCTPSIASAGTSSASMSSGFHVFAAHVRNQKPGLLMYGVSGRNQAPFQGGKLCVMPPIQRTPTTSSGGSPLPVDDCTGIYTIDMNAFASGALGGSPLAALTVPSTVVDCQWWGRDPGFEAPNGATLSKGLEYVVCPK